MIDEKQGTKPALERPVVTPSRYVTIELASHYTGYTPAAIRSKIKRGDWREDREYRRAPDGRIFIDLPGVQRWIESR
jgi:hypothetical protein